MPTSPHRQGQRSNDAASGAASVDPGAGGPGAGDKGPIPGGRAFSRYLRLRYLNDVRRRVNHIRDADVVQASERKTDETVARVFRVFLKRAGLASYRLPTRYGLMHCYDSAPDSREKPLVFLHGIGSSGQCFSWLALMFMGKRRVVCPDLFHFCGFSEANNAVMTLDEHADSVREFVEALGTGPVDFCGLSLGGWIGIRLAARHPGTVSSLALLNPAGLSLRPYALRDALMHLSWKKFLVLYPGLMRAFPYTGAPALSAVLRRSLYRLLKEDAVRDFVKTVHTEHFVDDDLARVDVPTLLLWGREDRLLSDRAPIVLAGGIPDCEAWYVERCAHILCLEAPLNVHDTLARFLGLGGLPDNRLTALLRRTSVSFPQHRITKETPA